MFLSLRLSVGDIEDEVDIISLQDDFLDVEDSFLQSLHVQLKTVHHRSKHERGKKN